MAFKLSCVLFDLDGTLVDTAPDLIACFKALGQHQLPVVAEASVKPFISFGAMAMIKAKVGDTLSEQQQAELLDTMLDLYQNNIAVHSVFFDGITDTLAMIEAEGLKWGVVTNKRERFTNPLMQAMKLTDRAACIISGDTTGNPKPHPEPMLAACKQAGVKLMKNAFISAMPATILSPVKPRK